MRIKTRESIEWSAINRGSEQEERAKLFLDKPERSRHDVFVTPPLFTRKGKRDVERARAHARLDVTRRWQK
jgi:hypothetical protein